jgi:hypothetical protein
MDEEGNILVHIDEDESREISYDPPDCDASQEYRCITLCCEYSDGYYVIDSCTRQWWNPSLVMCDCAGFDCWGGGGY